MPWLLLLSPLHAGEPVWPWDTTRGYQVHAQMRYISVSGTWVNSKAAAFSTELRCGPGKGSALSCTIGELSLETETQDSEDPLLQLLAENLDGGTFTVKRSQRGRIRDVTDLTLPNAQPEIQRLFDRMVDFYGAEMRLFRAMLMCFDHQPPADAAVAAGDRWVQRKNILLEHVMTDHTVTGLDGTVATIEEASREGLTDASISGTYEIDAQTGVLLSASRSASWQIVYNQQMDAFPGHYEATCALLP